MIGGKILALWRNYFFFIITARPSTADISALMLKSSEDAARRHNERMELQREYINVLRESLKKELKVKP
jgi:hypothetical protein